MTTTFLAAIVLFRPAALAYSPMPSAGHEVLSNFAIDLFNRCVERGYGDAEQALEKSERARIVKANRREDSTRLIRRALNWHFYNPRMESRQRSLFFINRSFIPLFGKIEARLIQPDLAWREALDEIGRAIHFIEDLTVPAHSVPVFHGAGLKDPFESSPLSGTPSVSVLTARVEPDLEMICARLSSQRRYGSNVKGANGEPVGEGPVSLRRILDSTRFFTLARLDDYICDEPGSLRVSWHHFWLPPEAGRYFGAYRPGAQFGELKEINDGGLKCEITKEKYRSFATDLHLEAVFADVRALYWFSERHGRQGSE